MKRFISLMIAALLLFSLSVPAMAASDYVYFTGSCHIYEGPGRSYEALGIINKNSTLKYLGTSKDVGSTTWYKVEFNYRDGWASDKYCYLTASSGKATYGDGGTGASDEGYTSGSFKYGANVYINGNCNIRSGPALEYDSLGVAHKGKTMTGTGSISTDSRGVDWYSVKYDGDEAWVSSVYASLKKKSSSSSSSTSSKKWVVGDDGDSNVRNGPGLDYKKIGVLHKGDSAKYLGSSQKDDRGVRWYKISWKGSSAWVSSKYTYLSK